MLGLARADVAQPRASLPSPVDPIVRVLHGSAIDGKMLGDENQAFTNIRFSIYGRELFYDESVLFCDYVGDQFFGMTGPIEVRYEVIAHRTYEGVGCHKLLSVAHWSPPKQKGW